MRLLLGIVLLCTAVGACVPTRSPAPQGSPIGAGTGGGNPSVVAGCYTVAGALELFGQDGRLQLDTTRVEPLSRRIGGVARLVARPKPTSRDPYAGGWWTFVAPDTVRLVLGTRFVGRVAELQARGDSLIGLVQEYGDVSPPPPSALRAEAGHAMRARC